MVLLLFMGILRSVVYAQSRNAQVRQFNTMVDYMDESSRINRELYWDIKQFAEGYVHSTQPKRNDNYWWTHSRAGAAVGPFDADRGRFPELHVDERGMVSDFEFVLYPYLVARETMDQLLSTSFFGKKTELKTAFLNFKMNMDSLVILHRSLYEYVNTKNYLTDPDLKIARSIMDQTSRILDSYYVHANTLYLELEREYATLPVLKTQKRVLVAKTELDTTLNLVKNWEKDLYADQANTPLYDTRLRQYNQASLAKDSFLLFGTYGYGISNNGAMVHSRYRTFFEMIQPTLYWYAKDTYHYPAYMTKRDINYNEFVDRTHMLVEDYNDFIECADGKQASANLDYSMKMAAQIGIDTNQYVLLQQRRWGYLFHFVQPDLPKDTVHEVKKDSVISEHQQLINVSLPHHMVFLLDISASMHDPGKLDLLKAGAKYLVGLQRQQDHISLLTFSTHSHTLLRNVACNQKENIYNRIDELQAKGASNASEGVRHAFDIADSNLIANGKNKIILVTDGKFQLDGNASLLLGQFKKKKLELVIFLVGDGNPTLARDFEKIAKKGNGRFYQVDAKTVEDILVKEASD
jgi:hypothetical protein